MNGTDSMAAQFTADTSLGPAETRELLRRLAVEAVEAFKGGKYRLGYALCRRHDSIALASPNAPWRLSP